MVLRIRQVQVVMHVWECKPDYCMYLPTGVVPRLWQPEMGCQMPSTVLLSTCNSPPPNFGHPFLTLCDELPHAVLLYLKGRRKWEEVWRSRVWWARVSGKLSTLAYFSPLLHNFHPGLFQCIKCRRIVEWQLNRTRRGKPEEGGRRLFETSMPHLLVIQIDAALFSEYSALLWS